MLLICLSTDLQLQGFLVVEPAVAISYLAAHQFHKTRLEMVSNRTAKAQTGKFTLRGAQIVDPWKTVFTILLQHNRQKKESNDHGGDTAWDNANKHASKCQIQIKFRIIAQGDSHGKIAEEDACYCAKTHED